MVNIPTDKTTYAPDLIWNKAVKEYLNTDDRTVNYKVMKNQFLKCGYLPKTADKWIQIYMELNHLEENHGYIGPF